MMSPKSAIAAVAILLMVHSRAWSQDQPCTELGQTPSTAFPVCGTSTFHQTSVPLCGSTNLVVPGCSDGTGGGYQNKNPYFYTFTCFVGGTLGFVITPNSRDEDYDWQLYDITGHNPNDIFTDPSLVVTGNWAGTYGPTGASATGSTGIECGSDPTQNHNTFAQMPTLIVGHQYLLMVSHFTPGQSGYSLDFGGGTAGTAVITDPTPPHLASAKTSCDGTSITLKLNKKMKCSSLTTSGSEFSISPAGPAIVSATAANCSSGFDFDEVVLTLAAPLTTNNYQLIINEGADNNTVLDNCDNSIPAGEQTPFSYSVPQPIRADSVGRVGCAPIELKVYFPKKIKCGTISNDGTEFFITGPSPVTVQAAGAICDNNSEADVITVTLTAPIYNKGTYQLHIKPSLSGAPLVDQCGIPVPDQVLNFTAADTVSAAYNVVTDFGCESNTLSFTHNGAHDVNFWQWTFNDTVIIHAQNHTVQWSASSTNTVQLIVSNGVCADTVSNTVVLDNEVKANFTMPDVICPEDKLAVVNTSTGLIDSYQWNFDVAGTSNVKDPAPVQFPQNNIESFYNIRLSCTNNTLGCTDTKQLRLRVLDNCYIAVPSAFTPNGDGLNDYLYPNNALKAENLEFSVYNRWGQLVFHSRNWQEKWDGKIGGILQGSGVYVWFLSYTNRDTGKKVFQKGTTTLIR